MKHVLKVDVIRLMSDLLPLPLICSSCLIQFYPNSSIANKVNTCECVHSS